MKSFILLASLFLVFSCVNSTQEFEEWKINQIAENEGGGPIYQDTHSEKTIRFYKDRTVDSPYSFTNLPILPSAVVSI